MSEFTEHNTVRGESRRMKYLDDIAMVWIDLSITGKAVLGIRSKLILNSISGYLKFGTLTALMGASGSGKSTFLKCVNGENSSRLSTDTEIYVNKKKTIRPCFIVQDVSEHLLNGLTAKQSLLYASRLKNSEENFNVDHENNIIKLMEELMLEDIEDTRIDRCSGGEQKRLAIAAELTAIKMPNLLCIDEPTSGLDSNAAETVIKCLKTIAEKHHISVVTSIHQPNADILLMFDKLYVLSKGGKCVFFGSPHDLTGHLKLSGVECKFYQVPIEVLIMFSSKGLKNDSVEELITRNYDSNKYFVSKYKTECAFSSTGIRRKRKTFSFANFWHLFLRSLTNTIKSQWLAMIIQTAVSSNVSLVLALMGNRNIGKLDGCFIPLENYNINNATMINGTFARMLCAKGVEAMRIERTIDQNVTFIFVLCGLIQFMQIVGTTLTFATEIKVFFNEHRNGWYSTSSYYWAKSLVDLPLPVIISFLYVLLGYHTTNQLNIFGYRFFGFIYFTVMAVLCCQGIGFLMCIVFDTRPKIAITAAVMWFIVVAILCDYVVPLLEMHKVLQFVANASFLKIAFHASLIYIYGFERCVSGTVSRAMTEFELHADERFKLSVNYALITCNFAIMRVIALLVLMRKANPTQKRLSDMRVDSSYDVDSIEIESVNGYEITQRY